MLLLVEYKSCHKVNYSDNIFQIFRIFEVELVLELSFHWLQLLLALKSYLRYLKYACLFQNVFIA
jgi:hypothetical protein